MGRALLSNVSQLVERNLDRLHATLPANPRLLLVNPPADAIAALFRDFDAALTALHQDWSCFEHWRQTASDTESLFAVQLPARHPPADAAIVFSAKEKSLTAMNLNQASAAIKPNGQCLLVGENGAGIKSSGKLLGEHFARWEKIDSARHCTVFGAHDPVTTTFELADWVTQHSVSTSRAKLAVSSLPGVFSHGRLDDGTALLLANLPDDLSGHGLDFGCGCGVIGATLLRAGLARAMDCVDVSALALAATQATAEQLGVSLRAIAGDALDATAKGYDFIISNPPFHRGVSTHYAATERFLRDAAKHLRSQGRLLIVANAFLRYEPILRENFNSVAVLASNKRFKVYQAA